VTNEPVTQIDERVVAAVERVILGGVAITTRALDGEAEDLTFSQWRILTILGEEATKSHVRGVGERVGVSAPSASRLLRRLEDRGLIALERDLRDRRYMRVRLTLAGQTVRDRVLGRRRLLIQEALGRADGRLPANLLAAIGAIGAIGEALIERA
jgi:MarR family transcriptional regulator, organic hydroperoxide resistance regulator